MNTIQELTDQIRQFIGERSAVTRALGRPDAAGLEYAMQRRKERLQARGKKLSTLVRPGTPPRLAAALRSGDAKGHQVRDAVKAVLPYVAKKVTKTK